MDNRIIKFLIMWCGIFTIIIGTLMFITKPEIIITKIDTIGIMLFVVGIIEIFIAWIKGE